MGVRAKFNISKIELSAGNQGGKVILQAVSRGERNADWASATPSGTLEMQVNNPAGFEWFLKRMQAQREAGRYPEVWIDISDSMDGWPGDGHAFRLADVPEEHYQHGKCGECGFERMGVYGDGQAHPNETA